MLLVKILAGNTNMELPIKLAEFSSHAIITHLRGYQEYMSVWMSHIGDDSWFCRREISNEYDEYSPAIVAIDHFKREEVVGHAFLFISKTWNKCLHLPGSYASCKVTGTKTNRGIGVELEISIDQLKKNLLGKKRRLNGLKKHSIA